MIENTIISAAIVLYKNDPVTLKKTIDSFLTIPLSKTLYLIDNSPTDILKNEFIHPDIEYLYSGKNIGFGSAHNKIIQKIKNSSNFHLVLNPDVRFASQVVPNLVKAFEKMPQVALIGPKVLFDNGEHQFSCRKYPSLLELLARKVKVLSKLLNKTIADSNYQNLDLSTSFEVDYLTGCFLLFRTSDFVAINGFDERYFIYMEDVDICRKIDGIDKRKLYYPYVTIYHTLARGSSKKIKLFLHHSLSVFQYFYKWRLTSNKALQKNG